MRRTLVFALLTVTAVSAGAQLVAEGLREQIRVQQQLLEQRETALQENRALTVEAWRRVERGTTELLRAQRQGETVESLRLRDRDLREAESDLEMHLAESRQLRRAILEGRSTVAALEAEIARLGGDGVRRADPLTGTWDLVIGPAGHEGRMYLQLDGTLVQGTYELDGGWTGSMRGTFVSGKVRLERIDSQIGFAAIFIGQLVWEGEEARLQGTWEATQLAAGVPAAGTWVARRMDPADE